MTTLAVMQPTFMPWIGYFDLIDQADTFVYLDNVEFSRQSWHHRNRIKTAQGLVWLTLPVEHSQSDHTKLSDARIGSTASVGKWRKTIAQAYKKCRYAGEHLPWLDSWLEKLDKGNALTLANIQFIGTVCEKLGIGTPRHLATALPISGDRAGRLVALCEHFHANTYLSPIGAAGYLKQDIAAFQTARVEVRFQHYEHPVYSQPHGEFLPYASVVDLLMNEGPASLEIMRSGRRPAYDAETGFRISAATVT